MSTSTMQLFYNKLNAPKSTGPAYWTALVTLTQTSAKQVAAFVLDWWTW